MRQYSISPGNFAGGLTTIEEKSLGALAKSGSRPIQGVIKVAQSPPWPGLWLLDTVPDPHFMQFGYTNPNDTEGIMDLISVGSQILLFVTGRGSVIGSPVAPLVKITGNSETYRNLPDDIDFNAGRLLTGERTLDELGDELLATDDRRRPRRADQARTTRPPRVLRHVQAPGHAAAGNRLPGVSTSAIGHGRAAEHAALRPATSSQLAGSGVISPRVAPVPPPLERFAKMRPPHVVVFRGDDARRLASRSAAQSFDPN